MQSCMSRPLSMRRDRSLHQAAQWRLCPAPRQGVHLRTNVLWGKKPLRMIFGGESMSHFLDFSIPLIKNWTEDCSNNERFLIIIMHYRGSPNIEMDEHTFMVNRERAVDYLNSLDKVLKLFYPLVIVIQLRCRKLNCRVSVHYFLANQNLICEISHGVLEQA